MFLIHLIDFVNEPPIRSDVASLLQDIGTGVVIAQQDILRTLTPLESMRVALARARYTPAPTWDMLCKALLVCNISDLDPSKGLRALLGKGEADIICHLSAFRHTPAEYAEDFVLLLDDSRCIVREHIVMQSIQRTDARSPCRRRLRDLTCRACRLRDLTCPAL